MIFGLNTKLIGFFREINYYFRAIIYITILPAYLTSKSILVKK